MTLSSNIRTSLGAKRHQIRKQIFFLPKLIRYIEQKLRFRFFSYLLCLIAILIYVTCVRRFLKEF